MDANDIERFERYFEGIQAQLVRLESLPADLAELKDNVAGLKNDNLSIRSQLESLRIEMNERFISVDEQMRTLTLRVQQFEAGTQRDLVLLKENVSNLGNRMKDMETQLGNRMKNIETGFVGLHGRIDTLGDDMRQRFRGLNDRLSAIEKRNAA